MSLFKNKQADPHSLAGAPAEQPADNRTAATQDTALKREEGIARGDDQGNAIPAPAAALPLTREQCESAIWDVRVVEGVCWLTRGYEAKQQALAAHDWRERAEQAERRLATVRAETIEECAKVCDSQHEYWLSDTDGDLDDVHADAAASCAYLIRALSGSGPERGQKK